MMFKRRIVRLAVRGAKKKRCVHIQEKTQVQDKDMEEPKGQHSPNGNVVVLTCNILV